MNMVEGNLDGKLEGFGETHKMEVKDLRDRL